MDLAFRVYGGPTYSNHHRHLADIQVVVWTDRYTYVGLRNFSAGTLRNAYKVCLERDQGKEGGSVEKSMLA